MQLNLLKISQKQHFNQLVTHVIQSWTWGEFRKSLSTPVLRYGIYQGKDLTKVFQITFHQIPFLNQSVGYLPKGPYPDQDLLEALKSIGQKLNCAFIKIEPNIMVSEDLKTEIPKDFVPSPNPLFTKYNFLIDLTLSEEQLLSNMHPKTRYNIKIAQKHGVVVKQSLSDSDFEEYLKLYFETTKRQVFQGHSPQYHRKAWKTLKQFKMARILTAYYQGQPLAAWMLVRFKDTLYYPYGGSSKDHPEVMANNLLAWEAIRLGKKLGLKKFDMWGAANTPDPNPKDPYYGFYRFKKGYSGDFVEYIGTFDLVFNYPVYFIFNLIDKLMPLKILLLKIINK